MSDLVIHPRCETKHLYRLDFGFRFLYRFCESHMDRVLLQEVISIGFVFESQDKPICEAALLTVDTEQAN